MPRSPDLAIFVLTTDRRQTTDDRRQTKPITLPLAHARGVMTAFAAQGPGARYIDDHYLTHFLVFLLKHASVCKERHDQSWRATLGENLS